MHGDRKEYGRDGPLAAALAGFRRRVRHPLKPLENMTFRAPILVERHENQASSGGGGDSLAGPEVMPRRDDIAPRPFAAGIAGCAAAVGAFLLFRLTAWPPHEDETLALFVGYGSLPELLDTVLGERGGAPLHFVLAWAVAHAGGGLPELRLLSALLAVASVPVLAVLVARLAGRTVALVAAVLASASWILLFHGVYARMYSLFLLTSALSYLALLRALQRGRRRDWALWVVAILATVATHPYGALVLVSQGIFVLARRERMREATRAFACVALAGIPFWYTDLVLAGRFEVGVGGGGDRLGSPLSVLAHLGQVAGDFTVGWLVVLPAVLALAAVGARRLLREGRSSLLLTAIVFAVPTVMLVLARLGDSTSPESRHLIFALPFVVMLVAGGLVELADRLGSRGPALAGLLLTLLVVGELAWAYERTPPLFSGEEAARVEAREAASDWLARTGRPDDVLFGYEPVYLRGWEHSSGRRSRTVVPRADAKLALGALTEASRPLGRGVWVFDAAENNNFSPKLTIPRRLPYPPGEFEAKTFGPYLIVRTTGPSRTPERYLDRASQVMILGKSLSIGDADVNFVTVRRAAYRLERSDSGAPSASR